MAVVLHDQLYLLYLSIILTSSTMSPNIFDDQHLALLEDIFQKTPRPDGWSIQKTSMDMQISSKNIWWWFHKRRRTEKLRITQSEKPKCKANNTSESLVVESFNCLLCEEVSSFVIGHQEEYETHLKNTHKVFHENEILKLLNFMNEEKKRNIVEQAKKFVKKGDLFMCCLCQDEHSFVVGQFMDFKVHLGLAHRIVYEIGFILAMNFFSGEFKNLLLKGPKNLMTTKDQETNVIEKKVKQVKQNKYIITKVCNHCSFTTMSTIAAKTMRQHKAKTHFICKVCENKYENRRALHLHFGSDHLVDENSIKCSIDGCTRILSKPTIQTHVKIAHKERIWLTCDYMYGETNRCDKKYTCSFQLRRHKEKGHITFKPKEKKKKEIFSSPCKLCGKMIKENPVNLYVHMKKIHSNRPLVYCTQCNFATKDPNYLMSHESGHLGLIRCEICDISFTSGTSLKKHQEIVHGEGERFICSSCNFKTWKLPRLTEHKKIHNEKTFKCEQCDYMGATTNNLRVHRLRHKEAKFICEKCSYKTSDGGNFHVHKTVKHGNVVLKCEYCPDFSTKSSRSLRKHKERHKKSSVDKTC